MGAPYIYDISRLRVNSVSQLYKDRLRERTFCSICFFYYCYL